MQQTTNIHYINSLKQVPCQNITCSYNILRFLLVMAPAVAQMTVAAVCFEKGILYQSCSQLQGAELEAQT